jgi:predicted GNAT superfamily acetyltransferase
VEPEEVTPPQLAGRTHAVLAAAEDDAPRAAPEVPAGTETVTLAVPSDVEALRRSDRPGDRATASHWRSAFREAYAGLHEQGWRVRGFVKDGRYVLGPEQRQTELPQMERR